MLRYPFGLYYEEALTEAPVTNIEVPKVDPEVVGRDIRLLVRIYGDGVDMICVCVRVHLAGYCSNDVVLLRHAGKSQVF